MTALATSRDTSPDALSAHLSRFLQRRDLVVIDVVRGAAPDSRRLFLGRPGTGSVTHVIATSSGPAAATGPVDNEHRVLLHAAHVLGPVARASLPEVLERVDVYGSLDGLAMTAVPDLGVPRQVSRATTRSLLGAMPGWLARVWSDSADGVARVDVGADALDEVDEILTDRDRGRDAGPTLEVLRRARGHLAELEVPRTLTHGCLCPRHVIMSGDAPAVDDWGLGRLGGDPLRDLGRLAVTVLDDRLAEVLAGRTSFAATIRRFVTESMRPTHVPPRLWREVLVLSQLELAVEGLQRNDPHAMVRLSRAVRALHGTYRRR